MHASTTSFLKMAGTVALSILTLFGSIAGILQAYEYLTTPRSNIVVTVVPTPVLALEAALRDLPTLALDEFHFQADCADALRKLLKLPEDEHFITILEKKNSDVAVSDICKAQHEALANRTAADRSKLESLQSVNGFATIQIKNSGGTTAKNVRIAVSDAIQYLRSIGGYKWEALSGTGAIEIPNLLPGEEQSFAVLTSHGVFYDSTYSLPREFVAGYDNGPTSLEILLPKSFWQNLLDSDNPLGVVLFILAIAGLIASVAVLTAAIQQAFTEFAAKRSPKQAALASAAQDQTEQSAPPEPTTPTPVLP